MNGRGFANEDGNTESTGNVRFGKTMVQDHCNENTVDIKKILLALYQGLI